MTGKNKSDYTVQAVAHALDLLEVFTPEADEWGVTALSQRLKLHKNNIFRLLATLESRRYIEQDQGSDQYRLGSKNLELGQTFAKQNGLLRQARPELERLTKECGENAYVAVLKGMSTVYLDMVESNHVVRVVPRVGVWLPAFCTAAGKVQLAFQSEPEIERRLPKELKGHTPNTLTDHTRLLEHLREVAAQGYAVDDEELDLEVRGVAAPIRDYTRRVVGAVTVSGPSLRFSRERIAEELVPLVKESAREISANLGSG